MKIVIAGGGTAGHVFPAIALGRTLADEHGADVRFLGTPRGLEARLVPEAGFPFIPIDAKPLRRELSLRAVAEPFSSLRSVRGCRRVVADANVVVGVGGYVSVPAVLAAWRSRRPIVLHEQNAIPGLANRLFSRGARSVCVSFEESAALLPAKTRTLLTGNPVRPEILAVTDGRSSLAKEALGELGLEEDRRTVLVFGGSQGALNLDLAVIGAIELLRNRDDLQLVVLTGPSHLDQMERASRNAGELVVRPFGFLERMDLAYATADLVVARAGATTIAEITVCGLPSILVPYPHATANHQEANARALERAGGAILVPDASLSPQALARRISKLLEERDGLRRMAEAAAAWARPDAAAALAAEVLRVGEGSRPPPGRSGVGTDQRSRPSRGRSVPGPGRGGRGDVQT
jgi:UDP-N-acetylglucosamine--N-acetylmuramyl-(pentapeptide) pyrophosphoryl-undecaprenol N-acetylglucosamine transferase